MKKTLIIMLGLMLVSGVVFGQTPQELLNAGRLAACADPPDIATTIAKLEPLDTMTNLPKEITDIYPYYLTFAYMKSGKMTEAFNMSIKAIEVGMNLGALYTWTTPGIIPPNYIKIDSMVTASENTYSRIKDIHALRIYTRFELLKISLLMKEADNIIPVSNLEAENKKNILTDVLKRYGKIIAYNRDYTHVADIITKDKQELMTVVAESETHQSLILQSLRGI